MEDKKVIYMGSFNPPHLGHLNVIDQILGEREKLHLFVRYNAGVDLASREMKQKWFDRISAERGGRVFESILRTSIDEVWAGDDAAPLSAGAEDVFPDVTFRIVDRSELNSTMIRSDPEKYRSWLPDFVYEDIRSVRRGE